MANDIDRLALTDELFEKKQKEDVKARKAPKKPAVKKRTARKASKAVKRAKPKKRLKKRPTIKAEERAVHIRVSEPHHYRKEVLGLAIETIEMLKHFEEYKNIREEKKEKVAELKHALGEIKHLNSKLDVSGWPYIRLREKKAMPKVKARKIPFRRGIVEMGEEKPKLLTGRKLRIAKLDSEMDLLKRKLMEL